MASQVFRCSACGSTFGHLEVLRWHVDYCEKALTVLARRVIKPPIPSNSVPPPVSGSRACQ